MSIILSCVEFLVANLFVYISFQVRDEVSSQVVRIFGVLFSLLSFLLSPLLVKLLIVIALLITLPYISDRLSLYFYRQLKK